MTYSGSAQAGSVFSIFSISGSGAPSRGCIDLVEVCQPFWKKTTATTQVNCLEILFSVLHIKAI